MILKFLQIHNTILLNYFNYCDYNCDFMNNDNIH